MGAKVRAILVLHDDDPVGRAVVRILEADGTPVRAPPRETPADERGAMAFGCPAIGAVGDRSAADPGVLGAANMPGVCALVVAVRGEVDLKPLRTRGVPYTVL